MSGPEACERCARMLHRIARRASPVSRCKLSSRGTAARCERPSAIFFATGSFWPSLRLGDVQLIEENGSVYAECDNAAERLLLAVGGVSMGRVAGEGFEPSTFGL